jgi:hypothetical protein
MRLRRFDPIRDSALSVRRWAFICRPTKNLILEKSEPSWLIAKYRFSINRGWSFTDIYAEVPGEPGFLVVKLLSEDPQNYDDAPREGIRRILTETTGMDIPTNSGPAPRRGRFGERGGVPRTT